MTYAKHSLQAMTAIAAVLAFANPAIAQDATSGQDATTAPVTPIVVPDTTADPVLEPTVEPTAPTEAVSDPLSPSATTAQPAISPTAPAATPRSTRVQRTTPPARVNATSAGTAPTAPLADTPGFPDTAAAIPPLVAAPVAALPVQAVEPPVAPTEPASTIESSDMLPFAGAAGLGLLGLLGVGAAVRRRRRRDEAVEYDLNEQPHFDAPERPAFDEPMREPAIQRAEPAVPMMAAVAAPAVGRPIDAPTSSLPDGFDLSRFGPHVQAAYRGPTEDNPSLSLKNRLRRASAMDQKVRVATEQGTPTATGPVQSGVRAEDERATDGAVTSSIRSAPSAGGFMLGGGSVRPALRPVTQH